MENSITTNRLTLTLVTPDDFSFMRELVNTPGWLRFIGDRHVHTDEQAKAYIDRIIATKNFYYWVVRTKTDQQPIGIISLIKRDYLEHFDIGFAFLPEYQGKGYAYEGAQVIIDHSRQSGKATLLATLIPENLKSISLLEKMGFSFEQEMGINNQPIWVYKIQLL